MDDYTREMMDLKTLVTRTLEKKGVLAKIRVNSLYFSTIHYSQRFLSGNENREVIRLKYIHYSFSRVPAIQIEMLDIVNCLCIWNLADSLFVFVG